MVTFFSGRLCRFLNNQKGSALVILTLGLSVMLASMALVTDVGLMLKNKIEVVNAADAAVLAGAQALPGDPARAEALACEYAAHNGVPDISVEISGDDRQISVVAQRTVSLFFARSMGFEESAASAQATACVEPLAGVKGVVPLGVTEQEFIFGETYVLKSGAGGEPEGEYHSGWLGILALQGPGAKLYLEDLMYGFDEMVLIGDILNIQTGNISGKTYEGIEYRINGCKHTPSCTAEHYEQDCPKIMLVPVIEPYDHKKVRVKGFCSFLVDMVAGMGNESYITGKFIRYTTAGEGSLECPDNGVYVSRLIR